MGACLGKGPTTKQTTVVDENSYQHSFKVVILGDVSVGKSCILLRYLQNVFTDTVATIGEDYGASLLMQRLSQFSAQRGICAASGRTSLTGS